VLKVVAFIRMMLKDRKFKFKKNRKKMSSTSLWNSAIISFLDAANVNHRIRSIDSQENANQAVSLIEKVDFLNKFTLLTFDIVGTGLTLFKAKTEAFWLLKKLELIPRIINVPCEFIMQRSLNDGSSFKSE